MTGIRFKLLQHVLEAMGYSEEIEWAKSIEPCASDAVFFAEYTWVVIGSGMKNQVARKIQERIHAAWATGESTGSAFGHKGKVAAIDYVSVHRDKLFNQYRRSGEPLEYLKTLPWIGDITKYHLAKNLGLDVVKPDRHLVRIAEKYGVDCFTLCRQLAEDTGLRVAAVDQILWRAGNLGLA